MIFTYKGTKYLWDYQLFYELFLIPNWGKSCTIHQSNNVVPFLWIVLTQEKGAYYQVNPTLLTNTKSNIVTTLRTIEPYVLKALIKEDLRRHPMSKISEIASRIPDVEIKEVRKIVYSMVGTEMAKKGARVDCRYYLI